jgi:hypothetical protein
MDSLNIYDNTYWNTENPHPKHVVPPLRCEDWCLVCSRTITGLVFYAHTINFGKKDTATEPATFTLSSQLIKQEKMVTHCREHM